MAKPGAQQAQMNPYAQGNAGAGYRQGNMPPFQPAAEGQNPGAMEWMNLIKNQRGQQMMNPQAATSLGQFNQSLNPEQMAGLGQMGPLPAFGQMEQPNLPPFLQQLQSGESAGMPEGTTMPMPPWAAMGNAFGKAMDGVRGMFGNKGAQPMQQKQSPFEAFRSRMGQGTPTGGNIFNRMRPQPAGGMQNSPMAPSGGENEGAQRIIRKPQMPRVRY